jgi:hypothetical protein
MVGLRRLVDESALEGDDTDPGCVVVTECVLLAGGGC